MTYTTFKEKLEATETYISFPHVVRKITSSRNNVKHLLRGYLVAKNLGFKKFEKEFNYSSRNLLLIKEIIDHESTRL